MIFRIMCSLSGFVFMYSLTKKNIYIYIQIVMNSIVIMMMEANMIAMVYADIATIVVMHA